MPTRQARAEQATRTRRAFLDSARALFVENGYHATTTDAIIAHANSGGRGALYHHFADKQALFVAVLHEVQVDLGDAVAERIEHGDALQTLASSLEAFLDCTAERADVQRVLLIDGPAVLGWERWRTMEADYGSDALQQALRAAVESGIIDDQPLDPLAHMLLALVDEAALYIANSPDPVLARAEVGATINRLLTGLRTPPTPKRPPGRVKTPT